MSDVVHGALAGVAATVPMTWVMERLHRQLPERERYPLPPRAVTMELADRAGVKEGLDEPQRQGLTLAAHFGFGAAMGALYGAVAGRPRWPVLDGAGYGLAVWAANYLGLLPGLGLLAPATEQPPRRTALMVTAHLVWGAAAGLALAGLRPPAREGE